MAITLKFKPVVKPFYPVQYMSGKTILSNVPAQVILHDNKMKVVLGERKGQPEQVLFDVPMKDIEQGAYNQSRLTKVAHTSPRDFDYNIVTYIVNGTSYVLTPNKMSDGDSINALLFASGAKVVDPNKGNTIGTVVFMVIVMLVLFGFFGWAIIGKH